ncbi:hypothetical protein KEN51_CDS0281 [Pseudomonas phage vB_Pae10145-KEN51]|uniref:PHIKZ117.3 n=5 Tax=Viruses TaxID=10239 RepID=L7T0L0_BPDPK|nr:hypothetical protein FDI90_gp257 [Pseudomonas phage PA7]YP_009639914.1 PHIKZ117.3 [Pseudomonas phage phiKZ]ANM44909.1 hypothetical protein KTN4_151 [Pseudomonas phage KTN4]QGK90144.1 hypothetical protein [Pseudomonas phage vB_PA32_GUMS]QJB22787.1 hypothetical protein fnug_144 [Pseudomonas phage fnug]QOV07999.1 hypothetical protein [Pseudomonas phage vB_PaeM_kmuB]UNI71715.1 hypothetical protein Churi01_gp207 [Pseudomonas phage Churi01]UXD83127.1 hypothetical protein NP274_00075 [Pseudomona
MYYGNVYIIFIGGLLIFILGLVFGGILGEENNNVYKLKSQQFEYCVKNKQSKNNDSENIQVIKVCAESIVLLYPTNEK